MNATSNIAVGQRVYSSLYGGRNGIVHKIDGEQRPETVRSFLGGVMFRGGNAHLHIVFDNGGESHVPECIVQGIQWRIYDQIATAEEIASALENAANVKAEKEAQAKADADRRAAEREAHAAAHPHLLKIGDKPEWSEARIAAENVRRELKRTFPGIKFRVKSDHSSVGVYWTCGPRPAKIREIADRHSEGHFDGMDDSYKTDPDATFADVFGGARYVNCHREIPQDQFDAACKMLAAEYGVAWADHNTVIHGEYASSMLHRILNTQDLGSVLNGIRRNENVDCGSAEEFWIAF